MTNEIDDQIQYRQLLQDAYCRACGKEIQRKNEMALVIQNPRQNCILCSNCAFYTAGIVTLAHTI